MSQRLVEPAELLDEALRLAHDMADNNSAVVHAYEQIIDDRLLTGRVATSARNRADLDT